MAQEFIHIKSKADIDSYLERGYIIVENITSFSLRITLEGADLMPHKWAAMKEWDATIDHWLERNSIRVSQRDANKTKAPKAKKVEEQPEQAVEAPSPEPEPVVEAPSPEPEPVVEEVTPEEPQVIEADNTDEVQENS